MGIIAQYLGATQSIDTVHPRDGVPRAVVHELRAYATKNDPAFDSTTYGADDAVHRVAEFAIDPAAGTYRLRFHLNGMGPILTGTIDIADDEADVQAVINTAMTAAGVPGWADDDITVSNETSSGDDLTDGYFDFTFDGASVSSIGHGPTEIVTDFPALAATSETTEVEGVDDTMTPVDEVQRIAQYANSVTGGTYTLTLNLDGASPITTDVIAFDADEADVQTAINVAVTAAEYPSWSDDDITVSNEGSSGDSLVDGYLELTFDGTSVAGADHGQTTIDGTNLVTATFLDSPSSSIETNGTANREALQILTALNAVTFTPDDPGVTPTDMAIGPKKYGNYPSADLIRALARDAGIVEHNDDLTATILAITGVGA